ncbi:ATP-binding protein [Limnoglobus roseus]|uniref:histidine kinase n=1 Tax=Limnoglobus roseus TaxID=2598579 RepID=A0A5C1AFI2_9BACT|nr:ATP-binding protein [Limnoglobus roseus]QEL17570.1 PAS domain S-box protein [Limnoglobus roseus]
MNPSLTSGGLSAVLTTPDLARRTPRPPDHAAEARALTELAKTLAEKPRALLQRLAELAMDLCGADSAGVSILEPAGDAFRWHAIAGAFAPHLGGTIARDASPCGVVLERDAALMFSYPERHFPYPVAIDPPIVESILVPFHAGGKPVGTVWVVAHAPGRRFDPEDARLLTSLSRFAAAGWKTVVALDAAEAGKAELERRVEKRTTEVRTSEEKYRTLFNSIDQGFCVIDVLFDERRPVDYRFVEVNAAFEGQTGLKDAVGRSIREMVPALEAYWFDMYGKVISTGQPARFVSEAKALGRWYDGYAFPIAGYVGVLFADVTERKRMEVRLQEQEALIREAAELAHVGGWSFDPVTLEGDWTAETARIHGLDAGATASVADGLKRFPEADRERIAAAVEAARTRGTPYDLELDFTAADGMKKRVRAICRPAMKDGRVARVRGSLQDVTERHLLEEKLRQSQKMDAFGQLAGGVAHDFNNMLQVINGYAVLLGEELAAGDPKAGLVAEIRTAAERSATLTRQLLAFARQQVVEPKVLDLCSAAGDMVGMLRRLIGEDVRLVTDLGSGAGSVLIDPGQLEQVLLNLAVNARDAMPHGGTLTIAARNEAVADPAAAKPMPYAVLSVTDTGLGMPPEVQARVFEPFFTTKEVGKGTGLGLATVYGIVQQAGGHVRVRSKEGAGSTFEVLLPRAADVRDAAAADVRKPTRGSETVLVVEDEAAVRGLVRLVLGKFGYTVLTADDATGAERVAAGHAGPIHLVLSDVVMPGAGGRAAVAGVSARHPEAKVVFMSGYTDDAVMRKGVTAADVPFLQKPFTPAELAAKVRQVLDGSR